MTQVYNKTVIALNLDLIHSYLFYFYFDSAKRIVKIQTKQTLVNKIQYSAITGYYFRYYLALRLRTIAYIIIVLQIIVFTTLVFLHVCHQKFQFSQVID